MGIAGLGRVFNLFYIFLERIIHLCLSPALAAAIVDGKNCRIQKRFQRSRLAWLQRNEHMGPRTTADMHPEIVPSGVLEGELEIFVLAPADPDIEAVPGDKGLSEPGEEGFLF